MYLSAAGITSVGLNIFHTLDPKAIAMKISVAAHVMAAALSQFNRYSR
jgi:hypothetical protein